MSKDELLALVGQVEALRQREIERADHYQRMYAKAAQGLIVLARRLCKQENPLYDASLGFRISLEEWAAAQGHEVIYDVSEDSTLLLGVREAKGKGKARLHFGIGPIPDEWLLEPGTGDEKDV